MQLAAERIDYTDTPMPMPQEDLFLVSLNLAGNTVRPRRLDFVVDAASAAALWRLQRSGRLHTRFAIVPTGRRAGFMPLEEVRFDQVEASYEVADVHSISRARV